MTVPVASVNHPSALPCNANGASSDSLTHTTLSNVEGTKGVGGGHIPWIHRDLSHPPRKPSGQDKTMPCRTVPSWENKQIIEKNNKLRSSSIRFPFIMFLHQRPGGEKPLGQDHFIEPKSSLSMLPILERAGKFLQHATFTHTQTLGRLACPHGG